MPQADEFLVSYFSPDMILTITKEQYRRIYPCQLDLKYHFGTNSTNRKGWKTKRLTGNRLKKHFNSSDHLKKKKTVASECFSREILSSYPEQTVISLSSTKANLGGNHRWWFQLGCQFVMSNITLIMGCRIFYFRLVSPRAAHLWRWKSIAAVTPFLTINSSATCALFITWFSMPSYKKMMSLQN